MNLTKYLLSGVVVLSAIAAVNGQTVMPATSVAERKADAPVFDVVALDGTRYDSKSLRGKVVVIDFWFTGCPPCIDEIPKLNELVDEFREKDVVFIAPTWDDESTLRAFLKEHPFKYHIIPNAKALVLEACRNGDGDVVVPIRLVIDKDGKTTFKEDDYKEENNEKRAANLRTAIMRALNATPAAK